MGTTRVMQQVRPQDIQVLALACLLLNRFPGVLYRLPKIPNLVQNLPRMLHAPSVQDAQD